MPCQLARQSTWSAAVADFWNPDVSPREGPRSSRCRAHHLRPSPIRVTGVSMSICPTSSKQ
jgi:hypothetical protein